MEHQSTRDDDENAPGDRRDPLLLLTLSRTHMIRWLHRTLYHVRKSTRGDCVETASRSPAHSSVMYDVERTCLVGGSACARRIPTKQWMCAFHHRVIENGGYLEHSDLDDHKNSVHSATLLLETTLPRTTHEWTTND